jgi:hypothetical protein
MRMSPLILMAALLVSAPTLPKAEAGETIDRAGMPKWLNPHPIPPGKHKYLNPHPIPPGKMHKQKRRKRT